MKGFVYAIKCPILKRIVYIGATINTKTRFIAHRSGNYRTEIGLYVKSLKSMNLNVEFEILEEITFLNYYNTYDIYIAESKWIQKTLQSGIELLNQRSGPKGPRNKQKSL